MLAQIVGLKEWKDGSGFPRLIICANHPDNKADLEALEMIEEALRGVVGEAYGKKLCSTQKGSGQHGLMVVDLSAVLTMLRATQEDKIKKAAANAWVHNWLKDKVKPGWLPSVPKVTKKHKEYECRCGLIFKSRRSSKKAKSKYLRHIKRCAVLKELERTLFRRTKQLAEKINDGKKEKSDDQRTSRKTKGSKHRRSSRLHKQVVRGTKTGRTKRHHHKG